MTRTVRTLLFILFIQVTVTAAAGETGSDRIGTGQCPENVESIMAYSPFKPYWKFDKFKHDSCGESRKQQFAATALVMGLIPLTLKDVAWPERRIVHVTEPLPWLCDILVLALGLVPLPAEKETLLSAHQRNEESNGLAGYAWNMRRSAIRFMVVTLVICLLACYAALVFNEIYSKRSALGCVVPFFITAWYIVALLPASIHRAFAGRRQARIKRLHQERETHIGLIPLQGSGIRPALVQNTTITVECNNGRVVSAIQGADEDWPVQMAWGIYYIAGTLIFASIMAVTIIEMAVWVFLCLAVTGISKVLAFFICLLFEKTGQRN
ncbi:hypothetical protein PSV08DRAFT_411187 [Bipolaris maydis]|uniref:uncharacterized protein n=1 Tax=Cochliobolus heterostrophus TaxID=5016 RepID=UPI0024D9CA70|nr:hypothetical protein PSV08DRAFT_411187 [Bipolaris maydis]